jgi:hypothetical protein
MNHDALKLRQELAEAVSAREMMVKILKLDQRWREEGRWRTGGEVAHLTAFLREAAKLRLNRVCLEIDATAVKTAIDGDDRLSALGGIITELKLLPFSEFASWSVCVCPHSCNKTADAIAAYGCRSSSGFRVLWDVVPQFIELW